MQLQQLQGQQPAQRQQLRRPMDITLGLFFSSAMQSVWGAGVSPPPTADPDPGPLAPRGAPSTPLPLPFQSDIHTLSHHLQSFEARADVRAAAAGGAPVRGLQHELTLAWQQSVRADVRRRVASQGRSHAVWFEEACGYGAGAWLDALPQPFGAAIPGGPAGSQRTMYYSLGAADFAIALRRRLRLPFPTLRAAPGAAVPTCPATFVRGGAEAGTRGVCGAALDPYGDHCDSCPGLKGLRTAAHHEVRDALWSVMRDAKLQPRWEPELGREWAAEGLLSGGSADRPADVYVPGGQHGLGRTAAEAGLGVCIDVTRRGRQAPTYLQSPAATVFAAARAVKEGRTASLPPGYFVYALPFSGGGCFDEVPLRRLLRGAAEHYGSRVGSRGGGAVPGGCGGQDALLEGAAAWWLPRMSVALQRGSARLVTGILSSDREGRGGAEDGLGAVLRWLGGLFGSVVSGQAG